MKYYISSFIGGLVGAFLFLIFATYFFGQPFSDWFMSAHGIFFPVKRSELSIPDSRDLYRLIRQGSVITPEGLISAVSTLYGNVIQVLVGLLAGATFLAFLAVRWQSVQAAQEYVDQKAERHFNSAEFDNKLKKTVEDYIDTLDPATNPQIRSFDAAYEISALKDRIVLLEGMISQAASPEEMSE